MKCPFKTPVKRVKGSVQESLLQEFYSIEDSILIIAQGMTKEQADYIVQTINSHENQSEALNWLLEEYHYMSRKMTEINNIVQPLWGETRERRADYQLIEDFIEQIKEKGLDQALKEAEKK